VLGGAVEEQSKLRHGLGCLKLSWPAAKVARSATLFATAGNGAPRACRLMGELGRDLAFSTDTA
jgi:hypothetical protein